MLINKDIYRVTITKNNIDHDLIIEFLFESIPTSEDIRELTSRVAHEISGSLLQEKIDLLGTLKCLVIPLFGENRVVQKTLSDKFELVIEKLPLFYKAPKPSVIKKKKEDDPLC